MAINQERMAELVGRVALDDRSAFEQLYIEAAPNLMGLLMSLLQRREVAEDALQDTFVKVWHGARDYHPARGQVTTWLASIARYRALDILRGEQTKQRKQDELAAAAEDGSPEALAEVAAQADRTLLRECMQTLSGDQRQSVGLAFYRGFSHEELSRQLDTPLGTVKAWVRRGLQRLRECMDV